MGMQTDDISDISAFPCCWRWLNLSMGLPNYLAFLQCLLTAKVFIEPHNTANIVGNTHLQDNFFENSVEERHEFWDELDSVWEPIRKQFAWYDPTLLCTACWCFSTYASSKSQRVWFVFWLCASKIDWKLEEVMHAMHHSLFKKILPYCLTNSMKILIT